MNISFQAAKNQVKRHLGLEHKDSLRYMVRLPDEIHVMGVEKHVSKDCWKFWVPGLVFGPSWVVLVNKMSGQLNCLPYSPIEE